MKKTLGFPVLALLAAAGGARAQESAPAAKPNLTPIKVQVVITKFQGEKKVSSLPYTLYCNANEKNAARLAAGFDVPVVTKVQDSHSVVFKTVGTMINATAVELERGLYRLELNVDQSSIYAPEGAAAKPGEGWIVPTVPILRSFRASLNPILRDGQTAQHTAATDPINGEVVKVEVSVSAIK
jgi:hypothetical protein